MFYPEVAAGGSVAGLSIVSCVMERAMEEDDANSVLCIDDFFILVTTAVFFPTIFQKDKIHIAAAASCLLVQTQHFEPVAL